ncbi:hypothetical protein Ahy_A04g018460 [Arachis hypogaea]|uniref:Ubiquitin-like protease family profile domain-containing protein n=1 Tax=Arachis hypogaea TaxID=3818 RepID=A0A445DDR0_ARAHY|nr:hypothetical protein Ahy_A04g018460 [Arachis hypogaea]
MLHRNPPSSLVTTYYHPLLLESTKASLSGSHYPYNVSHLSIVDYLKPFRPPSCIPGKPAPPLLGSKSQRRLVVRKKMSQKDKDEDIIIKNKEDIDPGYSGNEVDMKGKGQKKINEDPEQSDKQPQDADSDKGPAKGNMADEDIGKKVRLDDDRNYVSASDTRPGTPPASEGDDMADDKADDLNEDEALSPIATATSLRTQELIVFKAPYGFSDELTDKLMHFVIEVLNNEGPKDRLKECVFLSPYLMQSLASNFKESQAGKYELPQELKDHPYFRPNQIRDQNLIMGPLLWKGHWWAYALDRKQKVVYVLDSIHQSCPDDERMQLDCLVSKRLGQILSLKDPNYTLTNSGLRTIYAQVPKQHNSDDCGVFVYKYLQQWKPNTSLQGCNQEQIAYFRKELLLSCVLSGSNTKREELLHQVDKYFKQTSSLHGIGLR